MTLHDFPLLSGQTSYATTKVKNEPREVTQITVEHFSQSDLTESLDLVAQKQLGLAPGAAMAAGIKPLTAREKLVEHQLKNRESEFILIENYR